MELVGAKVVDAKDSISKAVSHMKSSGLAVLVFRDKKTVIDNYLGMIDERQLRDYRKSDPGKMNAKTIAISTPTLDVDDGVMETCQKFFAGRFKTLPVFDKRKLVGVMDRWGILKLVEQKGLLKNQKVENFMTSPIISIDANAPATVANAYMREANVRRLAVIENGYLVGVVSVFDLLPTRESHRGKVSRLKKEKDRNIPVKSLMRSNVETVGTRSSLSDAVKKMLSRKKAGLIVVDKKRPVGIITAKDILEVAMHKERESRIFVSGLHDIEKAVMDDIIMEGEKVLAKISSTVPTEAIRIHVKRTGKQYYVTAQTRGRVQYRATASEYTLMESVAEVFRELKKQAVKTKTARKKNRKGY
jgi:predicted transcriptional regulator